MQSYYVMAQLKVGEQKILTKYSRCNGFQVTSDFLNSENLRIAIVQLCNELQVFSYSSPKSK